MGVPGKSNGGRSMTYFINTWRTPKNGNLFSVTDASETSLRNTDHPGNITVTLAPSDPINRSLMVVGTVGGFDTLGEIEDFHDAILKDGSRYSALDRISSLCDHTNHSISEILKFKDWPTNFTPKYVKRDLITPQSGALPELLDLLSEWREESTSKVHWVFSQTVQALSMAEGLRVSHFAESLEELLQFHSQDIRENSRMKRFGELIKNPPTRATSRITYFKQGASS